jgi:prepilin-type N-terminal cleavage/methylation domain-containing protein
MRAADVANWEAIHGVMVLGDLRSLVSVARDHRVDERTVVAVSDRSRLRVGRLPVLVHLDLRVRQVPEVPREPDEADVHPPIAQRFAIASHAGHARSAGVDSNPSSPAVLPRWSMKRSLLRVEGFTLIELLVVIAIIAI